MYGWGEGEVETVTLDSGVRLRRNAMDGMELREANDASGRYTRHGSYVDIRCIGGGITNPAFLTIKEEVYPC